MSFEEHIKGTLVFNCPNEQKHKDLLIKLMELMAVDCAIDQGKISGELYGDTVSQSVKDVTNIVDGVHNALQYHMRRIKGEIKNAR